MPYGTFLLQSGQRLPPQLVLVPSGGGSRRVDEALAALRRGRHRTGGATIEEPMLERAEPDGSGDGPSRRLTGRL